MVNAYILHNSRAKTPSPEAVDPDFKEPLPKVAYDTLKPKSLREKCREAGISDLGERVALQARHERWVIIYNANRDASDGQRKSLKQLHKELDKWEKDRERAETRKKKEKGKGGVDVDNHEVRAD